MVVFDINHGTDGHNNNNTTNTTTNTTTTNTTNTTNTTKCNSADRIFLVFVSVSVSLSVSPCVCLCACVSPHIIKQRKTIFEIGDKLYVHCVKCPANVQNTHIRNTPDDCSILVVCQLFQHKAGEYLAAVECSIVGANCLSNPIAV